jgi:hypothetical protein
MTTKANVTNIFSLENKIKQHKIKQDKIKQQKLSNSLILQTNSITDAIFDINASFYGDPEFDSKDIYSFALQSYYNLLSKNFYSVLKSQINIETHLEKKFIYSEKEYQTRDYSISGTDLDNLLGIEYQFKTIVDDEYYSRTYKITEIPAHQQIFSNACNNYANSFLNHLIGQDSKIIFPPLSDFRKNPNMDFQSKLMLDNLNKLIIKPSTYNRQTGEISTESDLDITYKEYKIALSQHNSSLK